MPFAAQLIAALTPDAVAGREGGRAPEGDGAFQALLGQIRAGDKPAQSQPPEAGIETPAAGAIRAGFVPETVVSVSKSPDFVTGAPVLAPDNEDALSQPWLNNAASGLEIRLPADTELDAYIPDSRLSAWTAPHETDTPLPDEVLMDARPHPVEAAPAALDPGSPEPERVLTRGDEDVDVSEQRVPAREIRADAPTIGQTLMEDSAEAPPARPAPEGMAERVTFERSPAEMAPAPVSAPEPEAVTAPAAPVEGEAGADIDAEIPDAALMAPAPVSAPEPEAVTAPAAPVEGEAGADVDAEIPDAALMALAQGQAALDGEEQARRPAREAAGSLAAKVQDAAGRAGQPAPARQDAQGAASGQTPPQAAQGSSSAQPPAAPPESADAFDRLMQARAGGEPAAQRMPERAPERSVEPPVDTAARGGPERAGESLRPSAPPAGQPPRFTPHTAQNLAAQIVRRHADGARVFEIRLDPPQLGRVGVRLEMSADQTVKAVLSAERPDTLNELQRTARDLEKALAEAGLQLGENALSFSLGSGRDGNGQQQAPAFGARGVMSVETSAPAPAEAALYGFALAGRSGLDIRA